MGRSIAAGRRSYNSIAAGRRSYNSIAAGRRSYNFIAAGRRSYNFRFSAIVILLVLGAVRAYSLRVICRRGLGSWLR